MQAQAAIFPVLKSNAYGHGLKHVVAMLAKSRVPYLAVDSYPEYLVVKKHSKLPVLLLWETLFENYKKFDHKITTFCVYNLWTIRHLWRLDKKTKIHLFLNTWMNREWIQEQDLSDILKEIQSHPNLIVEWVMSHFFASDEISDIGIQEQMQKFKRMYYNILDAWFAPIRRHIWNSAAVFKLDDDFFNAYRPGIALYGYNPLSLEDPLYKKWNELVPVLSIYSRVMSLQTVWPNEWVSYHHEYVSNGVHVIASIPFGYAEGLTKMASGKIFMKHRKTYFRQVGAICMNLSSYIVDNSVHIGDEVEILSDTPRGKNSLANLAQQSGTTLYEMLVKLDKGIRREII